MHCAHTEPEQVPARLEPIGQRTDHEQPVRFLVQAAAAQRCGEGRTPSSSTANTALALRPRLRLDPVHRRPPVLDSVLAVVAGAPCEIPGPRCNSSSVRVQQIQQAGAIEDFGGRGDRVVEGLLEPGVEQFDPRCKR